jgi:hypothetical protein
MVGCVYSPEILILPRIIHADDTVRYCSGIAYVYYDPDVLPDPVKKILPIQEPKGHGMSLEEYEKWRAQQAGYPTDQKAKTVEATPEYVLSESWFGA